MTVFCTFRLAEKSYDHLLDKIFLHRENAIQELYKEQRKLILDNPRRTAIGEMDVVVDEEKMMCYTVYDYKNGEGKKANTEFPEMMIKEIPLEDTVNEA